jgi:Ca2+-binding RTX toxin-like protein
MDTLNDINMVRGSNFADILIGGNTLNDGFESFEGGGGDDQIDGSSGYDRADYRTAQQGVNVNLATGVAQDGRGGTDSLTRIEGVMGSDFDDTLTGDAADNTFEPMAGNDVVDGGAGNDTLNYSNHFDFNGDGTGVNVDMTVGNATDTWGELDTFVNIENVRGSVYDDTIIGNGGNNALNGNAGMDQLSGGLGADTFQFSSTLNSSTNVDTIADYVDGTDKIGLDDAIFAGIGAPGAFNANAFKAGAGLTGGTDADDRIVYDTTTGNLYYDADGSGGGAGVQFATLTGAPATLDATDFTVF